MTSAKFWDQFLILSPLKIVLVSDPPSRKAENLFSGGLCTTASRPHPSSHSPSEAKLNYFSQRHLDTDHRVLWPILGWELGYSHIARLIYHQEKHFSICFSSPHIWRWAGKTYTEIHSLPSSQVGWKNIY